MKLFSNSLLRRYTPPTCTLEIWGKRSILSWWKANNHPNDLKFKLHFDDPKMLDDEQIILEGDRSELQLLSDIVTTYVQNLLACAPKSLSLSEEAVSHHSLNSSSEVYPPEKALNGKEGANISANLKVQDNSNTHLSLTPLPSLTPKGLLHHELDCSSLITSYNKNKILLSVSQLNDLVNALEECSLEAEISPNFDNQKPIKKSVVWAITALVALAAVGIPTVGIKWYRSLTQETALDESSSEGQSTIKDILPPVPLPPSNAPVPSPTLPPSLEQQKKLLPPSQLGQANSPSRNPTVAVVVPPNSVLPPAPIVPPAPERNTIVLTPNVPPNPISPPSSVPTLAPPTKSANTAYTMPYTSAVPTLPQAPKFPSQVATAQPQTQPSAIDNPNNTALLDTIPQVTEVREYFQQRWQPPEALKHTLEYRLVLNADGSIGRIIPLGKTAKLYLDRTNMPLMGEPFVSAPPENLENPQIRVVFSPDKTVKTFLEDNQEAEVETQKLEVGS